MPAFEPGKIRNVAVVGHRGTGKTSLVEALLFQAGETNRLGTIDAGSTVADWDDDEQQRRMSIALSLTHAEWQGRKLNLVDVPGDPSFQGEARCALRVVEGALFVAQRRHGRRGRDGAGLEARRRARDRARPLRQHARPRARRLLPRARPDAGAALAALRRRAAADRQRARADRRSSTSSTCAPTRAPTASKEPEPGPIPDELAGLVQEYREKLLDEVVQTDEALMEKYLEGEELGVEEVAHALKDAVTRGEVFPVACGVATKNLGTHALLDLIVEGVPSPAKAGSITHIEGADTAAFVFKTIADPFAGRINLFRVLQGSVRPDQTLVDARTHAKERMGSLLFQQGKEHIPAQEFGPGDIGAVAKLKEVQTGDLLLDKEVATDVPEIGFPEPVMSFAITPKSKGDEEKVAQAIRRLGEEDPTLRLHRDQQTGEEILSGMSQMHVEVALERAKRRFGVDVELHPPRVPYLETIRKESRSHARYKKQTGGRGQFGDCTIVLEPIEGNVGYEFVDKIVGGVIPQSFRPAVDKGIQEAMHHGELAGAPVQGVRVLLVDGSYHTVDSSEMAFKIAGSMAFKEAYTKAEPVLLEPIMELEVTVPDEAVGAVNGDLNSRRGRLHGMEPAAGMTTIKAEVPMAEMLTYLQTLTSITGGRGDYSMHFLRYEEVPSHVAQRVIEDTKREREAAAAH